MKYRTCVFFGLIALAVLSLPMLAQAQPAAVCPPGYTWDGRACRPVPPPPPRRYTPPPPPGYAPPPPPRRPHHARDIEQVSRRYATLRSCPGHQCPPVTTLSRGTPVRILEWQGPYVLVRVPGTHLQGWVKRHALTP